MTARDRAPAPPALHDTEQALLGAALADSATARAAAGAGLVHADFADPAHAMTWHALAAGLAEGTAADLVDAFERLQAAGQAELCGGLQHLNDLAAGGAAGLLIGQPDRVQAHVRRIQQAAHARRLLGLAEDLAAGRVTAEAVARAGQELQGLQATAPPAAGFVLPLRDGPAGEADPWQVVPVADLDSADLPPQGWLWGRYLPTREVTLLGAHGGTGKSMVALMLAVSVAVGAPLFGHPTQAAPVVFFSAEDDAPTLRRRLRMICRALGVPAEMLADQLLVLDASEGDALLIEVTHGAGGTGPKVRAETPAFRALQRAVQARPGALVVVDNASEVFDGNESARREVRALVRKLRNLARMVDAAVLLLAHVDKASAKGLSGGQDYSGSTQWHNSVRSRLAMSRDKEGALTVEHAKCNHGPIHAPLRLQWAEGKLPELDEPVSGMARALESSSDARAVLRLIHEFTQRGEWVSTATTSRTHAGKLLRLAPGFPQRLPDPALFELLRDAERRGWLERAQYPGPNRHPRERWAVTAAGLESAGIASVAPTAPTALTSEVDALPAVGAPSRAEAAPTAPTSVQGGVGGNASAASRRKPAADLERKP